VCVCVCVCVCMNSTGLSPAALCDRIAGHVASSKVGANANRCVCVCIIYVL